MKKRLIKRCFALRLFIYNIVYRPLVNLLNNITRGSIQMGNGSTYH